MKSLPKILYSVASRFTITSFIFCGACHGQCLVVEIRSYRTTNKGGVSNLEASHNRSRSFDLTGGHRSPQAFSDT